MSWTGWIILFIILQIVHGAGTWKFYKAAGRQPWEAFVPIYNSVILMKIINRPVWWTILLFLPVVNLIMFIVIWVETLRAFGYNNAKDTALVVLTGGLYLYYVNYTQPLVHIKDRSLKPRTAAGEWTSSILFAVVAATIVHTYVMQPFIIPTPSLEKTLLTGDFLFVSKFHYGPRFPMTPIAAPMVHDTIPVLRVKSYLDRPQLPYLRLPGVSDVKRNDIVVFNWPVDSVNAFPYNDGKYHYKPIDKKSNYVKRCVGVPGDTLSMVDGKVYINGEPLQLPERAKLQHSFLLETKGGQYTPEQMADYGITDGFQQGQLTGTNTPGLSIKAATDEAIEKLKATGNVVSVEQTVFNDAASQRYFPYDGMVGNSYDNIKPFLIPEKGMTTPITYKNIDYYRRIIEEYEGSEMEISNTINLRGNSVYLNGAPLTEYTFKQDYFWLMGDNRHNSEDSRIWGYVPETHVVGKPVFVWMSLDWTKGITNMVRWDRLFTTVNGDGQPTSYFVYFVVLLAGYFVVRKIMKNRKAKK
ncbi:signal peptidase I [Nonlabens sp. Hel1_33_55]|uniref:signal peptidase I n=1 Tax=Nonlabens sp. Hel1_33_55 TaxID=1336802 RepID=UPI000875D2BA|nr:signal peptidase I [Nonlabens sp. Hel1_33_55]SCY02120.1 signal peptidase I [Nonlabens sp. Hel1_33_55]